MCACITVACKYSVINSVDVLLPRVKKNRILCIRGTEFGSLPPLHFGTGKCAMLHVVFMAGRIKTKNVIDICLK